MPKITPITVNKLRKIFEKAGFKCARIEGKKKVEFRKLNIPTNIGHVVIYSTYPEKKIVGFFSVPKVTKATPKQLWKDFKQIRLITKKQ